MIYYDLARGVLTFGIVWAMLKSLKRAFGRSPLDSLPGPPGGSFLAGEPLQYPYAISVIRFSRLSSGHFDKVFDVNGWDYHKRLAVTCTTSCVGTRLALTQGPQMEVSLNYGVPSVQKRFSSMIQRRFTIFSLRTNMSSKRPRASLCKRLASTAYMPLAQIHSCYSAAGLTWGEGLSAASGEQHRRQRKMLNPAFSTARLRDMGGFLRLPLSWYQLLTLTQCPSFTT